MAKCGYLFGTIALASLMLGLIPPRQDVVAQDRADPGSKERLPADLALVPADSAAFVTFRLADLWSSPLVATFLKKVSENPELRELALGLKKELPQTFEHMTGASLTEVERLTVVLSLPPLYSRDLFDLIFPMIIATKEPFDRGKVIERLAAVQCDSRGARVYQSQRRGAAAGVLLRFIDDKTFVLFKPDRPLPLSESRDLKSSLSEPLYLAAGKNAIVGGLVPSAILEQNQTDLAGSFLLASNPLLLARSVTVTVDLGRTCQLALRLSYRKEVAAALGEQALRATLQGLQRQVRRELSRQVWTEPEEWLIQHLLGALESFTVEQEGKYVRASVDLKGDLSADLTDTVGRMGVAARGRRMQNNLKMLAVAMHNYHDANGSFPPAVVTSKDGKPLYSWRVLILPYVEAADLFNKFKRDEPWDSPNNKPLLAQMPKVFAAPGATDEEASVTHYQVFVGGGALFDNPDQNRRNLENSGRRGPSIYEITDGMCNTIMIVEAAQAVPWSKPQDLPYDPKGPLPELGGVVPGAFHCVAADGAVHLLKSNTSPDLLRALITKQGHEIVNFEQCERPGQRGQEPGFRRTDEMPVPRAAYPLTTIPDAGKPAFPVPSAPIPAQEGRGNTLLITRIPPPISERQIFRVNADGTGRKFLTSGADPALSPDSKRIAFVADTHDGTKSVGLFVMNVDGIGRKQLLPRAGYSIFVLAPNWSPDGKRIAFGTIDPTVNPSRRFENPQLYVVDADCQNMKRLGQVEGLMPVWSPDGKRLLFSKVQREHGEIWTLCVMDADGTVRELVKDAFTGAWSPDGRFLAYIGSEDYGLYVAQADGTKPRRLAGHRDERQWGLRWAADSKRLYFTREIDTGKHDPGDVESQFAVHGIDLDGGNLRRLTVGDQSESIGGTLIFLQW
jgi:hypothetical protein